MSRYKRIASALLALVMICCLVGCKSKFKPFDHMNLIMTASGYSDYEDNQSFIDSHTAPYLQEYIHNLFITPSDVAISRKDIYYEDMGNVIKLLGCYVESSNGVETAYWAYFEYTDEVLTTCHIYSMPTALPM